MPLIHVDTEFLQQAGTSMYHQVDEMGEIIDRLRIEAQRLNMAWYGSSSDEFVAGLGELLTRLSQNVEALSGYSYILRHQAELWDESDLTWTDQYQEQLSLATTTVTE